MKYSLLLFLPSELYMSASGTIGHSKQSTSMSRRQMRVVETVACAQRIACPKAKATVYVSCLFTQGQSLVSSRKSEIKVFVFNMDYLSHQVIMLLPPFTD